MVHEHESGPAVNMPYFFLSYARTPKRDQNDKSDPDRWVYKLYRDLCENILSLINVEPESVGFMDRENRLGVRWSEELTRALATCRVFVPLYSERYFESENCGKEWFAFARRELTHIARGPQPSMSAIVPVLWTTIDQSILPGAARSIQYNHRDLGARYCADGFYGIIKLNRYRDDYQLAVLRLAQRIVAVARETRISNEPPADYDALPSAFPPAPHRAGMTASDMQITVLALDNSNLPAGRTDAYYGNTPRTWSPYRPQAQCAMGYQWPASTARPMPDRRVGIVITCVPGPASPARRHRTAVGQRAGSVERSGCRDDRGRKGPQGQPQLVTEPQARERAA